MNVSGSWIGVDLPPIYRDGQEYFLLGHADRLYLVLNRCPHRGGPLKFGCIKDDDAIICPLHHGAFRIDHLLAQASTIRLDEQPGAGR